MSTVEATGTVEPSALTKSGSAAWPAVRGNLRMPKNSGDLLDTHGLRKGLAYRGALRAHEQRIHPSRGRALGYELLSGVGVELRPEPPPPAPAPPEPPELDPADPPDAALRRLLR